jgi:DNA processing protein
VGDPRALDAMGAKDLGGLGLEPDQVRDLVSGASEARARQEWDRAAEMGVRIVDRSHPEYPSLLLETVDPPLVLYIRGRGWPSLRPHVAIVGSRAPSAYGVNCAGSIAGDLAGRGVVVVSGMARGIDTAAHRGALRSGTTLAVLGTGVDRVYPSENRRLAEEITERGALISEFPLGTLPFPQNFPRRNRVLAGMTLGTLVVEAAERSGSLITARLALESNREVFAVPGPIHSPKSRGPHQLIQQGACLVTGWDDIARELAPAVELVSDDGPGTGPNPVPPAQAEILQCLSFSEEIHLDALLARSRAGPQEVYAAILELELGGLIRKLPGDRYIRNTIR